ncbi:hypothetical protein O988_02243 [Pseudogymnoascus sp. VKM F-3808]|nr:hypothetical protein O988_02243 [Pseudogymnoascus sp. VKM F-3808]
MTESIQFEDTAKIEVPTTPQPQHATLPSESDIAKAATGSPTTSMLVANPSSPPTSLNTSSLPAPALKSVERPKYSSPPPPSSITPPPSSQPPKRRSPSSAFDRDTTPTPAIFSSPPPTVSYDIKRGAGRPLSIPASHIATASASELREALDSALNENSRLDGEVHEARMAAAHYKLQHSLLVIETEEATKRMEVEHEMTRREVEILQASELARREASSQPPEQPSASARYIAEMKTYCESMDKDNALLRRRLERAKAIIAEKEEDISDLLSENHRYVGRIRENREHMRLLRSPGGLYAPSTTPRTQSQNFPTTPQYSRPTPKQHTPHSIHQHDSQDSFATLLLADRVLNDQNSAPSTPTAARFAQRSNSQVKHSRNVQSLSSLPSTPVRNSGQSQHLLPSVQFVPQSEPRYRTNQDFFSSAQPAPRTALPHGRTEKRRKSRDSTISASDAEELAAYAHPHTHPSQETRHSDDTEELESDDIQESQASAAASAMLRRDPRESFEVAASPGLNEATEKGALLQAKIFGSVTKGASAPKRKRLPDDEEVKAKKLRMAAGEGVGLGIYGA